MLCFSFCSCSLIASTVTSQLFTVISKVDTMHTQMLSTINYPTYIISYLTHLRSSTSLQYLPHIYFHSQPSLFRTVSVILSCYILTLQPYYLHGPTKQSLRCYTALFIVYSSTSMYPQPSSSVVTISSFREAFLIKHFIIFQYYNRIPNHIHSYVITSSSSSHCVFSSSSSP